MDYTPEQELSIYQAKKRHNAAGRPQVKALIAAMVEAGEPYEEIWKVAMTDIRESVKPENPGVVVEPPPFIGKGSTTLAWRDFALKVSDMEPEIIASMGRNDLITILIDRGIIPPPDFDLTGGSDT